MGNGSSSWRGRAIDRRNVRQEKIEPIRPQGGSKKNTKRWCRGVEGREHKPHCIDWADVKNSPYKSLHSRAVTGSKVLICTVCEKQLAFYWVSPWLKEKPPAPAWVTGGSGTVDAGATPAPADPSP